MIVEERQREQADVSLKELILKFQELKTQVFSGSLIIKTENRRLTWTFLFRMGRLAWSNGGLHSDERWWRHLTLFCPDFHPERLAAICTKDNPQVASNSLAQLLAAGLIHRQQLNKLTIDVATEVLFDLIQSAKSSCERLSYEIRPSNPNNQQLNLILPLLEIEPILRTSLQSWQEWQNAGLGFFSPNLFPLIRAPEELQQQISTHPNLQIFATIDGTQTLRYLASKNQQDMTAFTKSLLPLLRSKVIALSKDPSPTTSQLANLDRESSSGYLEISGFLTKPKPSFLVACIDGSQSAYKSLEHILKPNGYRCLGIQEPLKIFPILIENKPDFIFLDVLMPSVNGYEVCGQIRRTPSLQDIPVVILTSKDGLLDRMRAKMVGSTDFLTKPVLTEPVLKMLTKYLPVSPTSPRSKVEY